RWRAPPGAAFRHWRGRGGGWDGAFRPPVLHDVLRGRGVQPGHVAQQGRPGVVEVHPDFVHTRLDDLVDRLLEVLRLDVVLVQAAPDVLRIDLHELGQWVLQVEADGDGPLVT